MEISMQSLDDALSKPDKPHVNTRSLAECMEACAACEIACFGCADACLAETDLVALRRCIRLNLDCADVCGVTLRLLARSIDADAKLLRAVVEACARACATCGAECHLHENDHEHCRLCAEACRQCAERCGRVLRDLPDTYGGTHPPTGNGAEVP
jgi:hypothetical protein